jgi:hypothetical protein
MIFAERIYITFELNISTQRDIAEKHSKIDSSNQWTRMKIKVWLF